MRCSVCPWFVLIISSLYGTLPAEAYPLKVVIMNRPDCIQYQRHISEANGGGSCHFLAVSVPAKTSRCWFSGIPDWLRIFSLSWRTVSARSKSTSSIAPISVLTYSQGFFPEL